MVPPSKIKFVEAARQALSAAHLPAQDYMQATVATTAAMAGVEDSTIQTLARLLEKYILSPLHPNGPTTIGLTVIIPI